MADIVSLLTIVRRLVFTDTRINVKPYSLHLPGHTWGLVCLIAPASSGVCNCGINNISVSVPPDIPFCSLGHPAHLYRGGVN